MVNREYTIKAAFLYHFSTYIDWPDNPATTDEPFVIGVFQSDPFGSTLLHAVENKTIDRRPIEIRLIPSVADISQCQILFVPASVSPREQDAALAAARAAQVLAVGESSGFIERGGDVQFFLEGNKVRFAFSAEISRRTDLRISSKLLSLAKIVPPTE